MYFMVLVPEDGVVRASTWFAGEQLGRLGHGSMFDGQTMHSTHSIHICL